LVFSFIYQLGCVRDHSNYAIILTNQNFVDRVVNYGANELHADGTFKIVPSKPKSRQMLVLHCIIDNYVSLILMLVFNFNFF